MDKDGVSPREHREDRNSLSQSSSKAGLACPGQGQISSSFFRLNSLSGVTREIAGPGQGTPGHHLLEWGRVQRWEGDRGSR